MANFVKVTAHPETKQVINSGANPEYGKFRVESEEISMEGGFVNRKKRSALVGGKMEDLKALGLTEGKLLPGKIYIKESTTPSYDGQSAKVNPSTGETMTHNGSPIYRESFYTSDINKADEMLSNDKVEAPVNTEATKIAASL